jgi:hypothetical protein
MGSNMVMVVTLNVIMGYELQVQSSQQFTIFMMLILL